MIAVTQETLRAGGTRKQKREDVLVRFLDVAGGTREHQVVAPVICGLSPPRSDVIQRDAFHADAPPAIRADWPVAVEEPLPRVCIRVPARRQRRMLLHGTRGTFPRLPWTAGGAQSRESLGGAIGMK